MGFLAISYTLALVYPLLNRIKPMKKQFYTTMLFLLAACSLFAQQGVGYLDNWWRPNGIVHTMLQQGNTMYFGGSFSYIGRPVPFGAFFVAGSSAPATNVVIPNGPVYDATPDGAGGWYIVGRFSEVGGQPRNCCARINADGSLHPWNPPVNSVATSIRAVALAGSRVYIGGSNMAFSGYLIHPRYLVALDTSSGLLLPWRADVDKDVHDIKVVGNTVYVAGEFNNADSLNGGMNVVRAKVAAFDVTTGEPTGWIPDQSYTENGNGVFQMAIDGNILYAVGQFTIIGNQTRSNVAAIDLTTGSILPWAPTTNGIVHTAAIHGNTVYLGGQFTTAGGQSRRNIAAFTTNTGNMTSWNPGANNKVLSMRVIGNTLHVGGSFDTLAGVYKPFNGAFDLNNGNYLATNVSVGGNPYVFSETGNAIYVGGEFTTCGGYGRRNIGAINTLTGEATSWNPAADGPVYALAAHGGNIYAGGEFFRIGTKPRKYLAALSATTGIANAFLKSPDGEVTSLAVLGDTLFVAGGYYVINNQYRQGLSSFNLTSGNITTWAPSTAPGASGRAYDLLLSGNTLFVSGTFDNIAGQVRRKIASFNANTGTLTNWNTGTGSVLWQNANYGSVFRKMSLLGNTIYVSGLFNYVNGQPRSSIAAFDAQSGAIKQWAPTISVSQYYGSSYFVNTISASHDRVYFGGQFDSVSGIPRANIAAVDTNAGTLLPWAPVMNGTVSFIMASGSAIYTSGSFYKIDGNAGRASYAVMTDATQVPPSGPDIISFAPATATSGQTVVIKGTNLSGITDVRFGGTPAASYSIVGDTSILAIVGTGATGFVRVSSTSGTDSIAGFTYTLSPSLVLNSITAGTALCPGDSFQINYTAQGFAAGSNIVAVLSAPSGSFTNGNTRTIGMATTPGNGVLPAGLPPLQLPGNGYRIRLESTTPAVVSTDNGNDLTVRSIPGISDLTMSPALAQNFCVGSSVLLSVPANAAFQYQWQLDSVDIPGATNAQFDASTAGRYRVIVGNGNGCGRTSANKRVIVNAYPDATFTVSNAAGGNRRLTATQNGAQYQWYLNGAPVSGATNRAYVTSVSGDYHVAVTRRACTATGTPVTVTVGTGARQLTNNTGDDEPALSIYPNPSNGQATLHISSDEPQDWRIRVMDVTGRLVEQQVVTSGAALSIGSQLPPGLYTVEATSSDMRIVQQWVRQ